MKKIISIQAAIITLFLSACGGVSNSTPTVDESSLQTAAHETVMAAYNKTETASAPTATQNPTDTPSPALTKSMTPTSITHEIVGANIFYNGIRFTIDRVLGDRVHLSLAPKPPEYIQFSFSLEGYCREVGCVTVYQVEEFRKYPWGDAILDELQSVINTGSTDYFPTWGAGILIRAQTQHIRFQNGAGIRAVVERAQIGVFVNNEALVYDFHGLTDDGLHYVNVIFPINAPILPSTHDPKENTNDEAIPVPEIPDEDPGSTILNSAIIEYNQEAQQQLDRLSSSSYVPDLSLLDELVGSVQIASSYEE